ncbi:hypothetical protein D3C72_1929420 [compost metagenome]
MDILGTLLLLGQIDLDRRLEGAAQGRSTIGEGLIRLEFRQGLDGALGTGTNLVHVALQVAEIATDAAAGKTAQHQGAERKAGAGTTHFCSPLSL